MVSSSAAAAGVSGMYFPARRLNDLSSLTMSLRVNERVNWPFDDKQKQAGKTNWKNYDDGGESPSGWQERERNQDL